MENNIDQNMTSTQNGGASVGPIIGIIIIIIILVIGALYFWGSKINKAPLDGEGATTTASAQTAADSVIGQIKTQSSSDDVASIKEDLNADVYSDLDADLGSIGQELNAQ